MLLVVYPEDARCSSAKGQQREKWNLLVCATSCEINEVEIYFYFDVLSYCVCLNLFIK